MAINPIMVGSQPLRYKLYEQGTSETQKEQLKTSGVAQESSYGTKKPKILPTYKIYTRES